MFCSNIIVTIQKNKIFDAILFGAGNRGLRVKKERAKHIINYGLSIRSNNGIYMYGEVRRTNLTGVGFKLNIITLLFLGRGPRKTSILKCQG